MRASTLSLFISFEWRRSGTGMSVVVGVGVEVDFGGTAVDLALGVRPRSAYQSGQVLGHHSGWPRMAQQKAPLSSLIRSSSLPYCLLIQSK